MTPDDATPDTGTLSRRELRARTPDAPAPAAGVYDFDAELNALESAVNQPSADAQWADAARSATALPWLDVDDVTEGTLPADLDAVTMRESGPDLLADAALPSRALRTWIPPLGTVAVLAIAYSATMLLWPLNAVPPTVQTAEVQAVASEPAALPWPAVGSAGVSVAGISSVASSPDAAPIASLTKVVTSLMVLDALPLQPGESGPNFGFTYADTVNYWDYRRMNQSALDVPVGGVLSEYQMLQGILLGSANNYIDRLAREIWGSDRQFAVAAEKWLSDRGFTDITVVGPSGFDEDNVATPEALLRLADSAMQNPVFAEIVGTKSVELPGAGLVENTNGMLADPGVVGVKTGTLVGWNLLTAKDVTVNDTEVRLYASVLNQVDNDERLAVTRSLFASIEASLAATEPAVPGGTIVGTVSTPWGTTVDAITDDDANVVLWNGAAATTAVSFDLDDQRSGEIGTLTVTGPVDDEEISVSFAEELTGPSPLWRLTHPMELLGLDSAS